jgi:hypothetical protein
VFDLSLQRRVFGCLPVLESCGGAPRGAEFCQLELELLLGIFDLSLLDRAVPIGSRVVPRTKGLVSPHAFYEPKADSFSACPFWRHTEKVGFAFSRRLRC